MYYLISFVYNQKKLYCIWVSDDEDYVITKDDKILSFDTIDDLSDFEIKNKICIDKSCEAKYNLDDMIAWCIDEQNVDCGCEEILNLWNMCMDVANSTKQHFIGNNSIYNDLYEKLFLANDLFSDVPCPIATVAHFSKEDIVNIKKNLISGIEGIVEFI